MHQCHSILMFVVLTAAFGCQEAESSGTTQTGQAGNQTAASNDSNSDSSDETTLGSGSDGDESTPESDDTNQGSEATTSSNETTSTSQDDAGMPQANDDGEDIADGNTSTDDDDTSEPGNESTDAGEPVEDDVADDANDAGVPDQTEPEDLPGAGTPTCAGRRARLLECDLLSEGDYSCDEPETDQQACSFECLLVASCGILKAYECNAQTTSPLQACFSACTELVEPFLCVDEDLEIDGNWVCDGKQDCLDGSDEADCAATTFACESGDQQIPAANECDGLAQCSDGSDEDGCPTFTCLATEVEIPERWLCDGAEDCLDGSDEAGCARPICE